MKKGDSKEKKPIHLLQSHYYDGLIEAGCDEAGRGCLAGSVYAAAVILPQNYSHPYLKRLETAHRKAQNDIAKGHRKRCHCMGSGCGFARRNRRNQYP